MVYLSLLLSNPMGNGYKMKRVGISWWLLKPSDWLYSLVYVWQLPLKVKKKRQIRSEMTEKKVKDFFFFYMAGLFTFKFSCNLINLQVSYPILQMKGRSRKVKWLVQDKRHCECIIKNLQLCGQIDLDLNPSLCHLSMWLWISYFSEPQFFPL